jgi:hypothetical protein
VILMRRVYAGFAIVVLCFGVSLLSSACRWGDGQRWGSHGEGAVGHFQIESLQCDERVFFVLAANGCSGSSSGGGEGAFRGRLHTLDGREIAWSCRTNDGTGGTVNIDGQRFNLSKGAVFLVSTNDKKTKVEQLAVDMSKLQGVSQPQGPSMREKLQALEDAEPRIAEFFKDSRALK